MVNDLKSRYDSVAGLTIATDFVKVQDVLSTQLMLLPSEMEDLDLEEAFVLFDNGYHSARIGGYVITPSNSAVTTAAVQNHQMTVTAAADGQTEIQIRGQHPFINNIRATHTLTVRVGELNNLIFRIKVFLEGAQ